jgi:hypothetical protein
MTIDLLREKIREAQPNFDSARLDKILDDVRANPPVLEAGLHWASTGTWPAEPAVRTWTPPRIASFLPPSSVLSALVIMQSDPEGVVRTLGEMYLRQHPPGKRSDDPFREGWLPDPAKEGPEADANG